MADLVLTKDIQKIKPSKKGERPNVLPLYDALLRLTSKVV